MSSDEWLERSLARGGESWLCTHGMGSVSLRARLICFREGGHVWADVLPDSRCRATHGVRECKRCLRVEMFIDYLHLPVQIVAVESTWIMARIREERARKLWSEVARMDPGWTEGVPR